MSWEELRKRIKNCPFTDCPRNDKIALLSPILFDRKEDALSKIEFLAVSQDVAVNLRKLASSESIEESLIGGCLNRERPIRTSLIYRMRELFGLFDPSAGKVYWTHALKCLPEKKNDEIEKDWKKSAPCCVEHFKNELKLISSKKLAIIAIGGYALALCRHVLEDAPLSNCMGIMKYIKTADLEKKFSFGEKEISLFPLIHPANREQVLKQYDKNGEVENREKEFIKRISKLAS